MRPVSQALGRIEDSVQEGDRAFDNWISASYTSSQGASEYRDEKEQYVRFYFERAFLELEFLLEQLNAPVTLKTVLTDHEAAKSDFMKSEMAPYGEPISYWALRLRQYVRTVETTMGSSSPSQITKDIIEILRATAYSITDRSCFAAPPTNEGEVHARVEAVLRCLFTDLRHKPPIGKPIKNFEPDTGLPSVRTLIEYKFVSRDEEVKRVADEVLADTRGYVSKEWEQFVYVIYETRRLKPEGQWNELMRASGVGAETQVVVLSGEDPMRSLKDTTENAKASPQQLDPIDRADRPGERA